LKKPHALTYSNNSKHDMANSFTQRFWSKKQNMFTSFARSKLVEKLQHKFCIVKAKAIMKLHKKPSYFMLQQKHNGIVFSFS
jgi:hypothetical protein